MTAPLAEDPRNPSLSRESREHKVENYNSAAFHQALGLNIQDQAKDGDGDEYPMNGIQISVMIGYQGALEADYKQF